MITNNDIERRITKIREQIESAKSKKARLEGQKEQLDRQKDEILAGFEELGVDPKEAETDLLLLQNDIATWLDEAEEIVEEYQTSG